MKRGAIVGLLAASTLGAAAGCARKAPPPRWPGLVPDRAAAIRRVAVLSGHHPSTADNCMLGAAKAMIEAVHFGRRYQVRSYRDVLLTLSTPDIDADAAAPAIDPGLATRLGERLDVDGILVLSMSRCGAESGDAMSVGLFATNDGSRLGGYETSRAGLASQGVYFTSNGLNALAQDTVDALERSFDDSERPE